MLGIEEDRDDDSQNADPCHSLGLIEAVAMDSQSHVDALTAAPAGDIKTRKHVPSFETCVQQCGCVSRRSAMAIIACPSAALEHLAA
jgi:hypothetical protein